MSPRTENSIRRPDPIRRSVLLTRSGVIVRDIETNDSNLFAIIDDTEQKSFMSAR